MATISPCEQASDAERFVARLTAPPFEPEESLWFVFQGDRMLFRSEPVALLRGTDIAYLRHVLLRSLYLGQLDNGTGAAVDCYAAELPGDAPLPEGVAAEGLRGVYPLVSEALFGVASRAVQLLAWDRTNQFCGQCGTRTENAPNERAKRCPSCGLTTYPRLSPAIIIAVVRHGADGPQLLLARNHRFPPNRYSVIAGYVEPGETLEECAAREVCEEVGVSITNLRYFGSQPWPFPNSLMLAFTAEYAGGELRLEESEIAEAGWFSPHALPGVPPKMSVARRLIDWFVATHS